MPRLPQVRVFDVLLAPLRRFRRAYGTRYPVLVEFVQFGLVGGSGFVVDVALFLGLQAAFGLQHEVARALSFWGSASWNWAWNRAVTFADRRRTRKRFQWPAFVLSSLLGFVVNWGTYYLLTNHVEFFRSEGSRILALFAGVVAGMGLNFVLARSFVFVREVVAAPVDNVGQVADERAREPGRRRA
ncbi:MAG: GtrA family protein [Planctomycetes bacterium]|nr:GtrA family protein [Planctomycetota bacterium]